MVHECNLEKVASTDHETIVSVRTEFSSDGGKALSRASSLRSLWRSASQGDEENQLQRVSVPA
jgi:hypothetical protein